MQCERKEKGNFKSFRSLPLPSPSSFARCTPSVTEEVQTSHQTARSNIIVTLPRMFTEMCVLLFFSVAVVFYRARCVADAVPSFDGRFEEKPRSTASAWIIRMKLEEEYCNAREKKAYFALDPAIERQLQAISRSFVCNEIRRFFPIRIVQRASLIDSIRFQRVSPRINNFLPINRIGRCALVKLCDSSGKFRRSLPHSKELTRRYGARSRIQAEFPGQGVFIL